MRLDNVMYKKSALSMPAGYLHLQENGNVAFTKYKSQMGGRVNVLVWVVMNIALLFMKDKLVLSLPKSDIAAIEFKPGDKGNAIGFGSRFHEIVVSLPDGSTHTFVGEPQQDEAAYAHFVELAKA